MPMSEKGWLQTDNNRILLDGYTSEPRTDRVLTVGGVAKERRSDLDRSEIRPSLPVLRRGSLLIRYLDWSGMPPAYKLRLGTGEPVALHVPTKVEHCPEDPWIVRDRM